MGGPPGDLYLEVQIAPHPLFTRQERDLHYRATLSFVEAALGATVTIPTLNSQARLAVPPGTQTRGRLPHPGTGTPGPQGQIPGRPGGGSGPGNP